jgi:TRAP-type C4-dicarboxylate transport system permease small subunit
MKSLLEIVSILSLLACLGALIWLGFQALGSSNEVGDGSLMSWARASGPLWVAGVALVINLAAGRLRKRLDR